MLFEINHLILPLHSFTKRHDLYFRELEEIVFIIRKPIKIIQLAVEFLLFLSKYENLSYDFYFYVSQSAFSMHSQSIKDATALDSSVIFTGPGNVRHHKNKENHLTIIQWQVRFSKYLINRS